MQGNLGWKSIVFIALLASPVFAQKPIEHSGAYCCYGGEKITEKLYSFKSDKEAEDAVARIVKYTGLQSNFTVQAGNVPNAMATMNGSQRLIVYSQTFMEDVRQKTGTDWGAISILAHEIGHHLQGHVLTPGGSRPELELEADKYSGFVLFNMGAKLNDAQVAMNTIGSDQGSATHPGRSARIAAIANGWKEAESIKEGRVPPPSPPKPQPDPQTQRSPQNPGPYPPTGSGSPQVQYVARCVFPADPNAYYLTSTNQIVGRNSYGQMAVVGQRVPPTYPDFAWMYQTPYFTYGVDPQGGIWTRLPNGVGQRIGYVTSP